MIIACLTFESVICTQWHWYFGCGIGQTLWTKNRVEKRKNRNYCVKKFWGKTTTPTTPTNINHHRRCFRNGICCVASSNEEILQSAAGIAKRPIDVSSINNEYCKCFKIQFLNFENRRLWFSLCVFFLFFLSYEQKKVFNIAWLTIYTHVNKVCNWQNALTLSIEKPSSWSIDFQYDSLYNTLMFDLWEFVTVKHHFMVLSIPSVRFFVCQSFWSVLFVFCIVLLCF